MSLFNKDIVLDEEAFSTAATEFEELGQKLEQLRGEIEEMMDVLKEGFNTPAGVKFINACESNLFRPMDAQKLVLEHIAQTLQESRTKYQSVFSEYDALQKTINSGQSGGGGFR